VSQTTTGDIQDLAAFGYKQVLNRTLGSFSAFAAGFSYISILTGVFQLFYVGYGAGGPAFYWTWPAVFLGQLMVALCFAELATAYPLSGGLYQWSRWIGARGVGWMAGWVYLCCSVITLAAVALALQPTLPQIARVFQLIGDPASRADSARNAVLLGCLLVVATTIINSVGVRLLAVINNIGVIAELLGVTLLITLLALHVRRGPAVFLDAQGRGGGRPLGYLPTFLAAALMASYVLYGFDTAGALAEETDEPRRRAPWAILQALAAAAIAGGLLMFVGILAVSDVRDPRLGQLSGGLAFLVKDVLGPNLGTLLLLGVIFAVFVCALAVHAGSVRLIFAMARDNNLPCPHLLAHVPARTRAPVVPAVLVGVLAMTILVMNINLPHVFETLCSLAIVWANLAYLLVTTPLLLARLRRRNGAGGAGRMFEPDAAPGAASARNARSYFSLGRFGLPINIAAVIWGLFVVINISWPRVAVYGSDPWGRFAAPLATLALVGSGWLYFTRVQCKKTGVLREHVAAGLLQDPAAGSVSPPVEAYILGKLAPED
jgi:urea carboxylase system permease